MSSIFGAEFGMSILTESILDRSLIGVVAPPSIRFVGSDALLAFQRGVVREVDYTQHNGNPELRFRFSRRVWGMKQVGSSWMIVG
jgi:hypothetical protein